MKLFSLTLFRAMMLVAATALIPVSPAKGQTIVGPTNQVVANGGTAIFSVSVSGTGPFTYQWQFNGTNINIITTVAGDGVAGYSGDGGEATNAEFYYPLQVAVDNFGNLYIADNNNNRIRKLDTNGIITTVAGNGTAGYFGDGGAATNAELNDPQGTAVDSNGNLFIADYINNRIRKLDTNGIITTVAGNGTAGYFGDGGVATNAELDGPVNVAVDSFDNLDIADAGNNRIREVNTNGIITTIVGKNGYGYSGDGGAATNAELYFPTDVAVDDYGNLFITDTENNRIRKVGTNGIITTVAGNGYDAGMSYGGYSGDGGAATNAELAYPCGVTVDNFGNVFIADNENDRVRKVGTNGIITTVAGNGKWEYSGDGGPATSAGLGPNGVAVDGYGNLFIADDANSRVRKVSASINPVLVLNPVTTNEIGNFNVIVSGSFGSVTSSVATLNMPGFIVSQPQDITVLAESPATFSVGAAGSSPLSYQWAFDGTNIVVATNATYTISNAVLDNTGFYSVTITNLYGSATSTNAALTVLPFLVTAQPQNITALAGGSATFVFGVTGFGLNYQWTLNGTNIPGATNASYSISSVSSSDLGLYSVTVTNSYGSATSSNATLSIIANIAQEPTNQVVVNGGTAEFGISLLTNGPFTYQWQLNGTNLTSIITTIAGTSTNGYTGDGGAATNAELYDPSGVAVDGSGNVFIADTDNQRIREVGTNGIITTIAGTGTNGYSGDKGAATSAKLNYPAGVAVDGLGNLYISDTDNNRVRKVATNGIITTVAGSGYEGYYGDGGKATNAYLYYPSGVAVDTNGNLYIADTDNQRIRKVGTNGIITTVAGDGGEGYYSDGGAATNAELNYPYRVAVDGYGNVFIADSHNERIREVGTNGIITTVAGDGDEGYYGDGGAATNAELNYPVGVAVDGFGDQFIADSDNGRIREVGVNGIITTVAGDGYEGYSGDGGAATNAELYLPSGLAVDGGGNLFIADTGNQHIRKVTCVTSPILLLNNISSNNVGNYSLVISYTGGSVTSSVVTLNIPAAIVSQPQNIGAIAGGSATFVVSATGSGPLSYQWTSAGTNIIGATNASYSISNVSSNNTGLYSVAVTNSYGGVTSSNALLSIAAYIAQEPTNQVAANSESAEFSISLSTNGPFTFQWQFNGTNLPSIITTVAGNGEIGYFGDGGAASSALLNSPVGVTVDSYGDLFVADDLNKRIRMVGANGIITTVAGNGLQGYSGDGGAATNAELYSPARVTADTFGDLYIADTGNQRIRRVAANGIITTVVGNGIEGYFGDGGAATSARLNYPYGVTADSYGNLYVADTDNQRIRKVGANGIITTVAGNGIAGYSGDGGAATNEELNYPYSVTLDSFGNLYIADTVNGRIRKVSTNGIITTVAAGLNYPSGVAVDRSGNLYIADTDFQRIHEVGTNGIITNVAGNGYYGYSGDGGVATNAELYYPHDAAVDAYGNLFIADTDNQRIRYVNSGTSPALILKNISANNAGDYSVIVNYSSGSVTSSVVNLSIVPLLITSQPQNVAALAGGSATFSAVATGLGSLHDQWVFDGTNIFGATNAAYVINNVSSNNIGFYSVTVTNSYTSVTSSNAALSIASYITQQPSAQLATIGGTAQFSVSLSTNGAFSYQWQVNGTNLTNIITTVAGNGYGAGDGSGGYSGDGGVATNAELNYPFSVAVDSFGNLFIADYANNRIRKMGTNGVITTMAGEGYSGFAGDGGLAIYAALDGPAGVAVDNLGDVFIADTGNGRIRKVGTNGIITTVAGNGYYGYSGDGGKATNATLSYPEGVAVDVYGNLFIADTYTNRVREVGSNGIITTVAGNGKGGFSDDGGTATNAELNTPHGLAVDSSGNLFIADSGNMRIREVGLTGLITTVAGTGVQGYSGDGDEATNALLYYPFGVAVDGCGNLFIADTDNQRIREVGANGIISTVAGNGQYGYSGDDGAAAKAELFSPEGVAVDGYGNLYIADTLNERIRKVNLTTSPTLTLNTISKINIGNYSVVISYSGGSITSSIVNLSVVPLLIASQPQSTSAILDSNATFSVSASGPGPLAYQWFFDSTNQLAGTTNLVTISNVQPTNAGYYTAIIENTYGSVTSSEAGLTVTLPPIVPSFTQTNGSSALQFSWNVLPGLTYQVQYTTNLMNGNWINLGSPVTTTNSAASILDSITTDPQRFYRVVLVQ